MPKILPEELNYNVEVANPFFAINSLGISHLRYEDLGEEFAYYRHLQDGAGQGGVDIIKSDQDQSLTLAQDGTFGAGWNSFLYCPSHLEKPSLNQIKDNCISLVIVSNFMSLEGHGHESMEKKKTLGVIKKEYHDFSYQITPEGKASKIFFKLAIYAMDFEKVHHHRLYVEDDVLGIDNEIQKAIYIKITSRKPSTEEIVADLEASESREVETAKAYLQKTKSNLGDDD